MSTWPTIKLKNILCVSAALIFFVAATSCAISHKFGPYKGKVVDAESGKPIEGAVVFMKCSTSTFSAGGSVGYYADATEVLTDEKGEFYIELRVNAIKPGHGWRPNPEITIFKPGYGVFPGHNEAKADILVRDTSHYLPENTYVTIRLPKLMTIEDRKKNLFNIRYSLKVPIHKRKKLSEAESFERVHVGLKP